MENWFINPSIVNVAFILPFTHSCKWMHSCCISQPPAESLKNAYVALPHQSIRLKNVFFRIFCKNSLDCLVMSDLLNSLVRMLRVMWQIYILHTISVVALHSPMHTGVQGGVLQARQIIIVLRVKLKF